MPSLGGGDCASSMALRDHKKNDDSFLYGTKHKFLIASQKSERGAGGFSTQIFQDEYQENLGHSARQADLETPRRKEIVCICSC